MSELLYPDRSYQIMGACFNVYEEKGSGFLERVYHECLQIEFQHQNLPFVHEKKIDLSYRDRTLDQTYRADFTCFEKILLEVKAIEQLQDQHKSQMINYLLATELELGILINFGGHPELEYQRIVHT